MASNYINGYSTPRFIIYTLNNTFVENIDLNLTGENGLIEEYEFYYINHTLINFTNLQKVQGYHINFNLSYESYSPKDNSLKIKRLIDYFISNNHKIYLVPRIDWTINTYEVILTNDNITLGIMKNGSNAIGNKLINLQFKTKFLQTNFNWYNTTDLNVTLEDFITTN